MTTRFMVSSLRRLAIWVRSRVSKIVSVPTPVLIQHNFRP
jgi:hypothetical protein